MRILYLCHRIPYPPNKGEKIRAFHQLQAMKAAGHEVDLFTLADDPKDLVHVDPLRAYCRELVVARLHPKWARFRTLPYLFTRSPLTISYFHSAQLRVQVRRAIASRDYDRVFIYSSGMATYVSQVNIPMLIDLVDVDSNKWTQYAGETRFPFSAIYRREARTLERYERAVCEKAMCVLVSTEREARLARAIAPRACVHVLPNGVDTEYFQQVDLPADPFVIFTGDMSYFPNEEAVIFFARHVLPLIRREISGTRFLIVGRNPGSKVRELGTVDGVQVTGFVPDVRTWLGKARVAVAPFKIAAGIQNKILEAMASGLPVVATSRAAQGLSGSVAQVVQTGDSAEELASRIVLLLRDSQLSGQIGRAGRQSVIEHYSWHTANSHLLHLLDLGRSVVQT